MHTMFSFATLWLVTAVSATLDYIPVNPYLAARQDQQERVVQIVTVSDNNGSLKYFPENVVAEVGSVVQFQFYPKNHTITESSFAAPCVPMASNLTTETRPGQKSGFVPVTADTQFRPIYNLIVNDTKPMWIFCGQKPHCQKGMAMVINQNMSDPDKTLEKYKAAAAALPVASSSASAATGAASATSATFGGGATTVTPAAATDSGTGPSLAGSTTGAATASATIAAFNGRADRNVPAMLGLLAGAAAVIL